jgi:hypothetical protein
VPVVSSAILPRVPETADVDAASSGVPNRVADERKICMVLAGLETQL